MSEHITTELVEEICRHAVETDPVSPTSWDSVDPMVKFRLKEGATEFLGDVIPVLLENGWRPPALVTDLPF